MSENKREEALSEALAIANNNIEELQTKVAFQEHTIEALNEALASQQKQLEDLHYKVRHVIDRVKSIQPSNIAPVIWPAGHTPINRTPTTRVVSTNWDTIVDALFRSHKCFPSVRFFQK